jgi:toxin ParE1/3/4
MAQVTLSKEAQRDLVSIRNYIRDELYNPTAAQHIISSPKKSVQSLSKLAGRECPLDALIPVHTEYRYLVCKNYCIFYLEGNDNVIVVRILHQRQDCLRALFLEN